MSPSRRDPDEEGLKRRSRGTSKPSTDGSRDPSNRDAIEGSRPTARTSGRRRSQDDSIRIAKQNGIVLSLSGMFLLVTTKFADALTTGVALGYVPEIYEKNPIAWYAFDTLGLAEGLLVSSFVIVVGIISVTEVASMAVAIRRRDRHLTPLVRAVGYGLPSLVFGTVAVHNVTVVLEGLEVAGIL